MKKFTVIILALVFVFSLSVSALAAGGSTDVTVTVDSSNISVTLPLNAISITAMVNGGDATEPTNYEIANTSAIPIKVDTIAVTMNNENWVFSADPIEVNTASTAEGKNQIYLNVNGYTLAASAPGDGDVAVGVRPDNALAAGYPWNIAAGETKNLPLVCSTSQLNTTDDVTNLITITYVVSAGSYKLDK